MKRFFLNGFSLLLAGGLFLSFPIQHDKNLDCIPLKAKIFSSTEKKAEREDGPELAARQEFEMTKDPALGYVPRERLYGAFLYAKKLREENETQKQNNPTTQGATSTISWTARGPNNWGGRTECLLVDPNDGTKKTMWAGGADGGLWKTTDITVASPVWTPVNDLMGNMAVTALAYDPTTPTTMYFGTGEGWWNLDAARGDGIWKSTNGGNTWAQLASTVSASNGFNWDYINKIVVDASGNVFAATSSRFCNRGGIFKSTNSGTTWALVLGTQTGACGTSNCSATDIEIAADGTLWASLGIFYAGGIYKSTNSGTSWTQMNTGANGFPTTGYRISIACAPSNAATVYAMVQNTDNTLLNIYKTTNAGTNWTTCTLPSWKDACAAPNTDMTRTQAWYDLSIVIDPVNANNVFIGGVDLMKSTDGGTTWTQISDWNGGCYQLVHADQHAIIFQPGSSDIIYFGNDGGVWRTANGTAATPTITSKNPSYNTLQFYCCALHPASGTDYFLAGAQDNGSHQFTTAGINSTTQVSGGDGAFCHIDQNNASYQFTSYVYSNYYRSTNGGTTFSSVSWGTHGQFINPSDYDNSLFKLYAGYDAGTYFIWNNPRVGVSANARAIAAFGGGKITATNVSPNVADQVYFGIDNGRVVRVSSASTGAPAGVSISAGLPATNVSCVCVQPGNENHILVTYSNYGTAHVWETVNGGGAWTNITNNIPDMPVWWALFNPYDPTQVLLGTELGVWATDLLNGGTTSWVTANSGLANVRVNMLRTRTSDNLIAAATHGRGLFTAPAPDPLPVQLLSFNAHPIGETVDTKWSTATEMNNDYFTVEHSKDGINFTEAVRIKGAGNSSTTLDYSATDYEPYSGISYYRLKQTDFNGKFSCSNIVPVDMNAGNFMTVFPNPAVGTFYVSVSPKKNEEVLVVLRDLFGRECYSKVAIIYNDKQVIAIDPQQKLMPGVYTVVATSNDIIYEKKIVIQ